MFALSFENAFIVLAWSVAGLWLCALVRTICCFKKQKPLVLKDIGEITKKPFVSILVPARNEARRVLEKSVSSMLFQTYEDYELIVLNDRSIDKTKEILENLQLKTRNAKLKIIDGVEPDKSWLGKPHALEQAFCKASGEWILTTDADIIFAPETLQAVVNYAESNDYDALTLIPKQLFGSFWETLFMPIFGWFCLLSMPAHRVNDPKRKESMGVGNFFMFRRACLENINGFESVKAEVAEDLRLAEIIKNKGFKLRIDYAPDLIETRMYAGLSEIWEGFSKNLFSGMKFSLTKTIFGTVSIVLFGIAPVFAAFAALFFGSYFLSAPLIFIYLLQIAVFAVVQREWNGNALYAALAPAGLALFTAILINSTVKVKSGKGVTWKNRSIYESGGVQPPTR
ncbi:MAG: glycosyl transferase family 2 [Acidobacteria bacterium]|jgi:chlorobactene glucosyltransferase|nr:glycosyl transferase family 2 [Acidobacteriota bacterium]